METFERNWYVLHTYSGYENKVKANIESRAQSMGNFPWLCVSGNDYDR